MSVLKPAWDVFAGWRLRSEAAVRRLPLDRKWFPLIAWALVALMAGLASMLPRLPNPTLATIAALILVAALWSISSVAPSGLWSPPGVFLLIIGAFHLGLAPYWMTGVDPQLPLLADPIWYGGPLGATSLIVVMGGVIGFTAGTHFVFALYQPLPRVPQYSGDSSAARWVAGAGSLLLTVAVALWFIESARWGGVEVFTSSYYYFLDSTQDSIVGALEFPISMGLALTMVSRFRNHSYVAIAAFSIFSIFAFLVGVRGGVLYPIALAVTVLAFRRALARPTIVMVGGIIMLSIVNIVKRVREVGISNAEVGWFSINPFAGLAELGGSIRIVAIVSQWHDVWGEPYRWGSTYTVTVARSLELLFSPEDRPLAMQDDRLFNQLILARQGPLGGSIIGEALHNFGPFGVVVGLMFVGGILAYFSASVQTPWHAAVYTVVAASLMYHIRNDFAPVLPWIVAGSACVAVLWLLYVRVRRGARSRLWPDS